jgi:hypothetical protein
MRSPRAKHTSCNSASSVRCASSRCFTEERRSSWALSCSRSCAHSALARSMATLRSASTIRARSLSSSIRRSARASAERSSSMSGGEGGTSTSGATEGGVVLTGCCLAAGTLAGAGGATSAGLLGVAGFGLRASSAGISWVPLWSISYGAAAAVSVGIASGFSEGISMVASAADGTAQLSVCPVSSTASLSVASYAATSRTGNSAVASLSTSVEDALFSGGMTGHPLRFFSGILVLAGLHRAEDLPGYLQNANALRISVKCACPARSAWLGYRCRP